MIAERADISVSTFFRYFESKLDVIYLDYRRSTLDLLRLVEKRLTNEPALVAVMNASIEGIVAFASTPHNRERLIRAFQSPNFTERRAYGQLYTRRCLEELLLPHLKDGPDPHLQAGLVAMLVRGAMNVSIEVWAAQPEEDLENVLHRTIDHMPRLAVTLAAPPR